MLLSLKAGNPNPKKEKTLTSSGKGANVLSHAKKCLSRFHGRGKLRLGAAMTSVPESFNQRNTPLRNNQVRRIIE